MTEPDVQGNEREGSGKKAPAVLILAPIIFLLLWSSGFAYVKMGLAYSGPITYLTLRFGLGNIDNSPIFFLNHGSRVII